MHRLTALLLIIALSFASCNNDAVETENITLPLSNGSWRMTMTINDTFIPLRFNIDSTLTITIVNSDEEIAVKNVSINGDSIRIRMPRFDSEFVGVINSPTNISGHWYNYLRDDYSIPFDASFIGKYKTIEHPIGEEIKYEVWFSPNTEDEYKALGLFHVIDDEIHGTFLTETGDYRYLQGVRTPSSFNLTCFDGSHLFGFTGDFKNDSIVNGVFLSGKHWSEPWIGVKNDTFELANPDSLTYLLPGHTTITTELVDFNGEISTLGSNELENQVTIIQIFGSWCPNCYDEHVFYKELYADYHNRGLNIIPIAFERTNDFAKNVASVKNQFEEIGILYPAYIGGKASKTEASEKFPMLNKIISFPTSIYLDKKGKVRKIHTGFYGPGTGVYYESYTRETRIFLEQLLAE
jgi:thiol-disulfide isomerase/thioredoxin